MTIVVAAAIERGGRVLICQRSPEKAFPLKWEFPGGKVEAGEDPVRALERELREELAIQARIGGEIARYEYCYPGRNPILLVFYRVGEFDTEPRNLIFQEIRWESPDKLPEYDFLEGDAEFVRRLAGDATATGPERPGPCSTAR
jgi:8-oxo-dGTP diphosphatase